MKGDPRLMMSPRKVRRRLVVAGLAVPAFMLSAPAVAFADTGYGHSSCTSSEHAGPDGAGNYSNCHETHSYTNGNYNNGYYGNNYGSGGVLSGILGGLGL